MLGIPWVTGDDVSSRDTAEPGSKFRGITTRHALVALKALVSVGALVYLGFTVDRKAISEVLNSNHGGYVLLSVVQMLLIAPLGGKRWQLVLRRLGCDVALWPLTRLFWIGMAFSQVLPSAVGGDALRVVLLHRSRIDVVRSAMSVLIERGLMLLSAMLVVVLAAWYAPARALDPRLMRLALGLLLAGMAGLAALPAVEWTLDRLPESLRLARFGVQVVRGLRAVIFSPRAAPLALLCLVTNLNLAVAAWWLSVGFGLSLSFLQLSAVITMVTLATVIPVSVGGWGVREAAMIALMTPLAVPSGIAFLFSIAFGLAIAISSLPGLLLLWWRPNAREIEAVSQNRPTSFTLTYVRD